MRISGGAGWGHNGATLGVEILGPGTSCQVCPGGGNGDRAAQIGAALSPTSAGGPAARWEKVSPEAARARSPVLATLGEVENFFLSFFDHLLQTRAMFDPLMDGLPPRDLCGDQRHMGFDDIASGSWGSAA